VVYFRLLTVVSKFVGVRQQVGRRSPASWLTFVSKFVGVRQQVGRRSPASWPAFASNSWDKEKDSTFEGYEIVDKRK